MTYIHPAMAYFHLRSFWAALSLLAFSLPTPVFADVAVPVDRLASQLQDSTQIPILIPASLPGGDTLYTNVTESHPDSYELSFTYTPDCQGTACTWGYFHAQQGILPSTEPISSRDTVERVTFTNGVEGWFTNFCGAYCTASAQWVSDGVLYVASIKNGRREAVIALANSAIAGGEQTALASSTGFLNIGTTATLTSRDPGAQINIRDSASPQAYARHYGLAGDQVRILKQSTGSDGQIWYQVEFLGSGATGWVRGDFVSP